MKQNLSLIWKEWREFRAYLFIGLGVFLGLPFIGGLEDRLTSSRHFQIETLPWVACFGGALAIFAAVGATCRDLSSRIEDFWRAVPMSVARWMTAKFSVGLLIVLVACTTPLLVENCISPKPQLLESSLFYNLFFVAVYSIAFAAGCLLRRTAQAAMMGFGSMLLLWFLPILLPPLAWMNILNVDRRDMSARLPSFACSMLGIGAAALILAIVSVRRGWQIESGRKLIYGSISATFILLLGSA